MIGILNNLHAKRVVDVGAGNGALCRSLVAHGLDVVGLENDAQGVAIARQAAPEIPFFQCGVQDDPPAALLQLPLFDAAVSTEVIEHLYSPHLLPRLAARLIRPGGHLIVSTPYHGYLKNLVLALTGKLDSHFTALWHGGHIKFWSRRTLTRLLEDNGFEVLRFEGAGRLPWLWKSMILVAQRRVNASPDR